MASDSMPLDLDPHRGIRVEVVEVTDLGSEAILSFVPRHAMTSTHEAIALLVSVESGRTWMGRFEGGYPSPKALTRVTNGPEADQLVVVNQGAGFIISAANPESAVDLNVAPVTALVVDRVAGVVLVADFTNVTAVGVHGRRWSTEVSWDGVELDAVENGVLIGRGWDAPVDAWVPFAVDVTSGKVLNGPTERPR